MNYICVNGKVMQEDEPALLVANGGYRYGDGLFETMKLYKGQILLQHFHFERLFAGLTLLKFGIPRLFSTDKLVKDILDLCRKNECEKLARIRLSVFRGNGGLYDEDTKPGYVIECWPLDESANRFNENGLLIDIFPDARKSCDKFSHLKSASFQPYTMAALYAKENKLNDCLVLNTVGNIADSTIANIFLVKDNVIISPALSEGCISGVMRRYLLGKMQDAGYTVKETSVSQDDLDQADEIFLTNAIKSIRWARQFREKIYTNTITGEIYNRFIKPLY
ncbi:MAG: aminotransferase class IV [Bacteroidota bacterium]